ncbi:class I adenylate-forming enzyme family protein [Streptomyces sp. NPDC003011]
MNVKKIRAELAADPDLGTGNVLTTLVARGEDLDTPTVTFDTDVDGHPAWEPLTLRQLDERVAARAAWLSARGIGRRDPVAVWVGNAADQILSFLALTRLGAIPALLNGRLAAETAAAYTTRLRAVGLLTDAERRKALEGHDPGTVLLDDIAGAGSGDPADAPEPYRFHQDDPVVITHSSGTTGLPKAVIHSHRSLFAANKHRLTLPRAQGMQRMLGALPAAHAATLIAFNLALCNRAEVCLVSQQSGTALLDAIERWRPHSVFGFAAFWSELASEDLTTRDLGSVRLWWNTGDCAHEAHIRKLVAVGNYDVATREGVRSRPGSMFIDGLGSTEMGHSQFFITHTPDTNRYGRCIGKPHSFSEIGVLDDNGDEVPVGETGQLGVKAPTLADGYWNDSVTTYRTRSRGYFLTGDLVYRDAEGYYYHVDRAVDSARLPGGGLVHTALSEEQVLAGVPPVRECTVVAVRHEDGTVVTDVLLTLHTDAGPRPDPAELRERVLATLDAATAATVRDVVVADESQLPLGPTGKVLKVLLRERHRSGTLAATAPKAQA